MVGAGVAEGLAVGVDDGGAEVRTDSARLGLTTAPDRDPSRPVRTATPNRPRTATSTTQMAATKQDREARSRWGREVEGRFWLSAIGTTIYGQRKCDGEAGGEARGRSHCLEGPRLKPCVRPGVSSDRRKGVPQLCGRSAGRRQIRGTHPLPTRPTRPPRSSRCAPLRHAPGFRISAEEALCTAKKTRRQE